MIRQAFLVILACASLLVPSAAACACSHHVEKQPVKTDCHSHTPTTETAQAEADENACDKSCICAAGQASPFIASKGPCRELKTIDELAKPAEILTESDFVAVNDFAEPRSAFVNDVSYSSTLKSLLPARAPPRL